MYKIVLLFCLLAVVSAAPGLLWNAGIHAYNIPAPFAYHSGYNVIHHVEPVEQHGYSIAY